MKNRIITSVTIIAAAILIVAVIGYFHLYKRYSSLSRDIMNSYRNNGRNLSLLVEETFSNSILMVNSFERHLYDEMLNDLSESHLLDTSDLSIQSEGFFFSEKPGTDSFRIYINDNGSIYSIARDREWYEYIVSISGPGKYIQKIGNISSIAYVIIQDDMGIITATENIDSINSIMSDRELMYSMVEKEDIFREYAIYGNDVYEYIHPMTDNTLLRIGFEYEPVRNSIMQTRIMFASIAGTLAVFLLLLAIIIFLHMHNIHVLEQINAKDRQNTIYLNQIDEGVIIADSKSIKMINSAALKILGINRQHAENAIAMNEIFADANGEKDIINRQMQYNNKVILYTKRYVEEEDYFIITFSDITAFNALKEENEIKKKQAILGELTFRVAHELKNPLNGMYIILQRIMENADERNRNLLEEAIEEVARMNKRIVDFTKFSKPVEYKIETVEMSMLIDDVIRGVKAGADTMNIEIEKNIEYCTIRCDYEQIYTALKNILINAVESIEKNGRISIEGYCQNDYIIYIRDEGRGMDNDVKERVFELYFTTKRNGSGIGMANAYKIITDHGGTIDVQSAKDKGTTVTVKLKHGD